MKFLKILRNFFNSGNTGWPREVEGDRELSGAGMRTLGIPDAEGGGFSPREKVIERENDSSRLRVVTWGDNAQSRSPSAFRPSEFAWLLLPRDAPRVLLLSLLLKCAALHHFLNAKQATKAAIFDVGVG